MAKKNEGQLTQYEIIMITDCGKIPTKIWATNREEAIAIANEQIKSGITNLLDNNKRLPSECK